MKGGEVLRRKQIHSTRLQLFPFVHIPDHEEAEATGFDCYSPVIGDVASSKVPHLSGVSPLFSRMRISGSTCLPHQMTMKV